MSAARSAAGPAVGFWCVHTRTCTDHTQSLCLSWRMLAPVTEDTRPHRPTPSLGSAAFPLSRLLHEESRTGWDQVWEKPARGPASPSQSSPCSVLQDFVFYAPRLRINKRILQLCMGNQKHSGRDNCPMKDASHQPRRGQDRRPLSCAAKAETYQHG